ncbi:MAG: prolyl oligopeptidase family serine peptidase [Actinomycetota bacterium]|nr:prolyl oligopeptidase family serine peptidase [Actinomycetota bacterium]
MDHQTESFPRQRARTRGFRLGAPRSFRIAHRSNGTARVIFVRSTDGHTPAGDLWVINESDGWNERCVVRAADLVASGELPAAELARRERLREVTSGITAYSVNTTGEHAAFAVDGAPYRVDLDSGAVRELPHPGPVVDPQMSPDGHFVAYVCSGQVFVVENNDAPRAVTPEASDAITWGLADFIAAEELELHRGMWWLADSSHLLIERVDETGVDTRWIGDPAQPEREPSAHRYPSAGTPNADVSLHLVNVTADASASTELTWDHERYPYLASVHVPTNEPSHATAVITVLSRDQQRQQVLQLQENSLIVRGEREQQPWVTVMGGVPTIDHAGSLIEILEVDGVFRVCRDGAPLSSIDLNVEAVLDMTDTGVVVGAYAEPTTRVIAVIDFDGSTTVLTKPEAWTSGVVSGHVRIEASARLEETASQVHVIDGGSRVRVASMAEKPNVTPQVQLMRVGERELATALLLPSQHEPGMRWPVICSPYGGPHAQRVIRAGGAYLTEQWLADQGFAVVVIDGRGTPGRGPSWEYAVHLDLATPVLQDQVDGLLAIADKVDALDITRVGIRGWSFGGYLAALAVMDRPDVFHAAVAGAPVTDWRLYDTAYTERYLGNPNDDARPYEHTSLLTRATNLTRPLLLIHGLADDNVLAAHTLQLSSALLAAGKPHNVLPLSGVTHMTPQEIVAENLLLTEVDFFRTHLTKRD